MAPVGGPMVSEAMFGHLIADSVHESICDEVQNYVMDLDEILSGPVYSDLLEEG